MLFLIPSLCFRGMQKSSSQHLIEVHLGPSSGRTPRLISCSTQGLSGPTAAVWNHISGGGQTPHHQVPVLLPQPCTAAISPLPHPRGREDHGVQELELDDL